MMKFDNDPDNVKMREFGAAYGPLIEAIKATKPSIGSKEMLAATLKEKFAAHAVSEKIESENKPISWMYR